MPRVPLPQQRLQRAYNAIAAGSSIAQAAEEAGIGVSTLKRYLAARRKGGDTAATSSAMAASPVDAPPRAGQATSGQPKASRRPPARPQSSSARERAPRAPDPPPLDAPPRRSPVLEALDAGAGPDETLLAMLRAELRHAIAARRKATADDKPGAEAKWSKRVEELVKAVERLEPPPPPPPDLVEARLRELDADAIALIEQHLPEPIDPVKELAA